MVRSTLLLLMSQTKMGQPRYSHQRWIDSLRIFCCGGRGGNGLPKYGGCGGNGGNVYFEANELTLKKNNRESSSLYDLYKITFKADSRKQNVRAESGSDSSRYKIVGSAGNDITFKVPTGVMVMDEGGKPIGQLDNYGDKVLVAMGGEGGTPVNGFIGQAGQKRFVRLDYKLIADLGLVGFPNAGKSTLLKAISKARPKIASYPFTTIKPNLGHIIFNEDEREITMADLPGLIEGASYNVGMGHRFLKHVERTSILVFVVDINGFQLKEDSVHRSAFETVALLNRELELYNPDLLSKPVLCLANKMDVEGAQDKLEEFTQLMKDCKSDPEAGLGNLEESQKPEQRIDFLDILPISAKFSQKTVQHAKASLRTLLDEIATERTGVNVAQISKELDLMLNDNAPRLT